MSLIFCHRLPISAMSIPGGADAHWMIVPGFLA